MNRRQLLASTSALALMLVCGGYMKGSNQVGPGPGTWGTVHIGGGGYVTGIDCSNDNSTFVCRTDTAGAYIWNAAVASWTPLITATSFSNSPITNLDDRSGGCVAINVAPSNASRIYMSFQGDVWISSDRGTTWTATGLNYESRPAGVSESNNGQSNRFYSKMAVDPANPDVVYYGTPTAGVSFTRTAGASWTSISTGTIPAGTGIYAIAFDPNSGTTTVGGITVTKTIYLTSTGSGVYISTDGGVNWALSSGSPTAASHSRVANDGAYYVASNTASTSLFKYSSGSWSNITPGSGNPILCALPDPADGTGARIIAMGNDGHLHLSTNRGASWATEISTISKTATQIPWLAATGITNISAGDALFDNAGNIWFGHGLGVSITPFSGSPTSTVWNSNYTKGIENLTVNQVCIPPSGNPLLAGWDQSVFFINNPAQYTTSHSPTNSGFQIHHAWGLDYATSLPSFIAYVSLNSTDPFGWTSSDKGVTWTQFSGQPSGGLIPIFSGSTALKSGGCVACQSASNIIIVPSNDSLPWYTKDGGATWTEIVLGTLPTSGETGYGHSFFSSCISVAADRVTANCFYLYNYRSTGDGKTPSYTGTQSLYRSLDSGDTWALMNAANIDTQANTNFKLVSVTANAGHLFLAGGQTGNPGDVNPGATRLHRSTDGGATWTLVGTAGTADGAIKEPYCVGVGAAKTGNNYPSVFFVGWLYVSGTATFGIWRSDNTAAEWAANTLSWTSLGTYPLQLSNIKTIDGSKESYGAIYAGYGVGSSYIYRTAD